MCGRPAGGAEALVRAREAGVVGMRLSRGLFIGTGRCAGQKCLKALSALFNDPLPSRYSVNPKMSSP